MAHLDAQLRAKHQVAPRRIEFSVAQHPEAASFQWNPKYPPINGNTVPINSRSTDTPKNKAGNPGNIKNNTEPTCEVPALPAGLHWNEKREMGCGLDNLGNTCFLNSALQCLTYTPPLANLVLQRWHTKACRKSSACLACELERHIYNALTRQRTSSFAPKNIVGNLKRIGKHFRVGRQEDSHEFLRYLIEGVQRAMSRDDTVPRVDQGALFAVFGGYLQSQVKCQVCGYESNTLDPALDLSLELKSKHIHTLQAALAHFCAPELLDGDNRYKCPRCNKKVRAQKQLTIRQPPHVLTLQLKRFGFGFGFGGNKITKTIAYPEQLTLDPYLSQPPTAAHTYALYGVLVHTGSSTHSGHYYSFVRAPNQLWYRCDDHHVSQVSHATALQQNAYLLFYVKNETEKREPKVTPVKQIADKSPLKSPEIKHGTHQMKRHENGTTVNGHTPETPVKVTPAKRPEANVSLSNVNTKNESATSVTSVNRAPVSIRGSGEWRVRDLSALSTLLAGTRATSSSETAAATPVTPVTERSESTTPVNGTSAVKASPMRVSDSKSPSNRPNPPHNVTRVKASVAQTPQSVVAQLHTQTQASAWDVPEGATALAEQQALVGRTSGAKRKRDEYDVDYDRGKVKKSKRAHIDPFQERARNPFQAAQNHALASHRPLAAVLATHKKPRQKRKPFKRD